MIVLLTERHWQKMLAATGLSDAFAGLSESLGISFATESDRYRHRDVITPLLARWFKRTPYAEAAEVLTRHRILWERYRSFAELGRDGGAALRELALFGKVDQPGAGAHWAPKSPVQVDGARLDPLPAPGIGQHNDEVLGR